MSLEELVDSQAVIPPVSAKIALAQRRRYRQTIRDQNKSNKSNTAHFKQADQMLDEILSERAKGRAIVDLRKAMQLAGLNDSGLPALALARADSSHCRLSVYHSEFRMNSRFGDASNQRQRKSVSFTFHSDPWIDSGEFSRPASLSLWEAKTPVIPAHLRPANLADYHILWEGSWETVPYDPLLLKRCRNSYLFSVVAAWDLTDLERMILESL